MAQYKGILDKDYQDIPKEVDINGIPCESESDGSREMEEKKPGDEIKQFIRRVYGEENPRGGIL